MSQVLSSAVLLRKTPDGLQELKGEELQGVTTLLYFAKKGEKCALLTKHMGIFYDENIKYKKFPIEIVFISLDESEEEMLDYYQTEHGTAHENYLALKWGDKAKDELVKRYGVKEAPACFVLGKSGEPIANTTEVMQVIELAVPHEKWVDPRLMKWAYQDPQERYAQYYENQKDAIKKLDAQKFAWKYPIKYEMCQNNEYEIIIDGRSGLGVELAWTENEIFISDFRPLQDGTMGPLEQSGLVVKKDVLIAVNGVSVIGESEQKMGELLMRNRPATRLRFRRMRGGGLGFS